MKYHIANKKTNQGGFRVIDKKIPLEEVRAPYIRIRGKVTGDVFATSRISISASSTVIGDIHYAEIELDQGAQLSGRLISLNEDALVD